MKSSITNQRTLPVWKRRTAWLALIPAVAILCLAAMPLAQSGEANFESSEARLEGSWLATVTMPDGTTFESPLSFCAGGAMIVSDPSVFPLFPMTTAYHGTWTKTGRREFVFTVVGFQYDDVEDAFPNGLYKIIIKETDTIEPDGDTYNGSGTVEFYSLDGTMVGTMTTPTHAVRIKAE